MGKFAASGLDSTGGAELEEVSNASTDNRRKPTEWHPTPCGAVKMSFVAPTEVVGHAAVALGVQQVQKAQ